MGKRMSKIALLVIGFVLLASSNASAEIYGTISGYIVEVDTNKPIVGIEVLAVKKGVEKPKVEKAISNSKGVYVLNDITAGTYILYLRQLGNYYFEKKVKEVTVPLAKNVVNSNFVLKKAGSVTGKVFYGDGTTSYANVGVIAQSHGEYLLTGVTDANGYYRIGGLPQADSAVVSVMPPGVGVVSRGDIKIIGGQDTGNINLVVKRDVANLSIKGKVLSITTQTPINKAKILIVGVNSTAVVSSNSNGDFEIYSLPSGKYDILITVDGYVTVVNENIDIIEGKPVTMEFPMAPRGGKSSIEPYKFFSWILSVSLASEAYAAESCECINCWDFVDEYISYAGNHQDDVYHTFAESLSCVGGDLCKNSKTYDDPKWLLNIMSCLNEKWEGKGTSC